MNRTLKKSPGWTSAALLLTLGINLFASQGASAGDPLDWFTWRGPEVNGTSREKNLPETFVKGDDELDYLWRKEEYATRSTPVIMNGRGYVVCRSFPETTKEGEKVVCFDAKTGDLIWESIHNIYLSDAPAERVGWSSVVGDPETGNVYFLGLGCTFQCLDGATGKILWQHSMLEEYGMLSTYGGRTNFPMVFEDLVIISGVMTGWGEAAVPAHRFLAFDKRTGAAVWFLSTKLRPEDTTYSCPVFTTFKGQAAMVFGCGDGAVYAVQPRTGKVIWKYQASTRGINCTPLIDNGIVYCGQGEQNFSDTSILGSIFAFDGNVEGEITESMLLWKLPKRPIGRSSPVKIDDRVYFVDDSGEMMIINAKTGKIIGKEDLGRIMFGSLVVGDGKIYAGEQTGRIVIMKPTKKGVEVISDTIIPNGEEIYGSPAISHGKVYIPTNVSLYCFGKNDVEPSADPIPAIVEEPIGEDKEVTQIQLAPVEMMLAPGKVARMQIRGYNKRGQWIKQIDNAEVTIEGGGTIDKDLVYTAPADNKVAAVIIKAKLGEATTSARARIIPPLPWTFDFNDEKVPPVWIGADYRHKKAEVDGEKVLVKVSTIPKGTRSQSWMGWSVLHDYVVQADFKATEKSGRLPDMGLINQRYTLDLQGSKHLQIRSWFARLENRFAKTIDMEWDPNVWYTMKFESENKDGKAILRGKVWKRGEAEPEWQIEAADETPNTFGSPGMFGNAGDAEFYIDNVSVTPRK